MNLEQTERFSRLKYPIHKVNAKTPLELFQILPGLRRYFERCTLYERVPVETWEKGVKTDKVVMVDHSCAAKYRGIVPIDLVRIIKYIIFVYDPDTDLIDEFPDDTLLLKEAALQAAGFSQSSSGEWPAYVQDIITLKEEQVSLWILDYLKVRKNNTWIEIKFCEEELEAIQRDRMAALIKGKVEGSFLKLAKERNEERERLYNKFFAEHTDLKKASENDLMPISPQNVFTQMVFPVELTKVTQIKDVLPHPR